MNKKRTHFLSGINCTTYWSKFRGLMFSKPKILIFHLQKPMHISLHMFFVFFPIDLIFLDAKKQVVEIKENFRPWNFYCAKQKAVFIIEAPQGFVKKKRIQISDAILFS